MKKIEQLPYYSKIEDSLEFFYRFREWIGDGYEIVIWWKNKERKCCYLDMAIEETGEISSIKKIIADKTIRTNKVDKFIENLVSQEIMQLETDNDHRIMRNFHDSYFILLENGNLIISKQYLDSINT